jgi:vitamin B12 transporter
LPYTQVSGHLTGTGNIQSFRCLTLDKAVPHNGFLKIWIMHEKKFMFVSFMILVSSGILAGNLPDTLKLQEIEISGQHSPEIYSGLSRIVNIINRETIRKIPANDLQDILEYVTSLDIRQRGSHGVQADISMRGGSFEQVLILLNGVRINDPQTGHHSMNIPVSTHDIDRIEILEGPGSRVYGPNAFSGAINIITREPGDNNISGSLRGGEYGYLDLYGSAGFVTGPLENYISAGNKSSGGFTDNTDFNSTNIFYRGVAPTIAGTFDLQAGYLEKKFGASNFYSSLYPDQYEEIRSSFTNLTYKSGKRVKYTQSAYWKRHHDRFELFRYEAAPWYQGHNYHLTDIYGTNAFLNIPNAYGNFYLGSELRSEQIYSSVLGELLDVPKAVRNEDDVFYRYFRQREQINLTAGSSLIFDGFSAASGILISKTGSSRWGIYGGADLSLGISRHSNLFASWNQSLRIPTFTEMYYTGPVHQGNPFLEPEEGSTIETGMKFFPGSWQGHVVAFRREGRNIIDWVKKEGELMWESRNITRINTSGLEFELTWKRGDGQTIPVSEFRMGYTFLDITSKSENYISAYVLDHLRHKIVTGLTVPLYSSAELVIMSVYQDRAGSYTNFGSGTEVPYDPFLLADVSTNFRISKEFTFSLQVSNLFNTSYTDIGNVPVPGRWIKGGISFNFPL